MREIVSLYLIKRDVNTARKNLIKKIYMNRNNERETLIRNRDTILDCQGEIPRLKRVLLP